MGLMETFRSFERITRHLDFVRARREGRRGSGRVLTLWALSRGETPPRAARLGLSVGRIHGTAPRRNLFKRRVRDIFRREKVRLPRGWDFLAAPKTARGAGAKFPPPFDELREEFLTLAARLTSERQKP